MKELQKRILSESSVQADGKIKINSFMGHQTDPKLINAMADEWIRRFSDCKIDKILTCEVSGITLAYAVASKMGLPLVIAKKQDNVEVSDDEYSTKVISYVHFRRYDVIIEKKYLSKEDHVLIIDDILSNGCSLGGLLGCVYQAGCTVEGIGIAIEKSFERGVKVLGKLDHRFEPLVKIKEITSEGKIIFG